MYACVCGAFPLDLDLVLVSAREAALEAGLYLIQ